METEGEPSRLKATYLLPNHTKEVERLSKQHEFFKTATDNQLLVSKIFPDRKRLKVLDSGCADGLWLRDIQLQLPDHQLELHGMDNSASIFPSQTGSGIGLHSHDVTKPIPSSWKWQNSFDIVHQRLLCWGIPATMWPTAIQNLKDVLKPGGFLQLVEVEWVPQQPIPDSRPACQKQAIMQRFFTAKFEKDIDVAYKIKDSLLSGGFKEVDMVQYDLGYGAQARNAEDRELSSEISTDVFRDLDAKMGVNGIPGVAKNPEEFHAFLDELKAEVQTLGYMTKINFAFGMKPAP